MRIAAPFQNFALPATTAGTHLSGIAAAERGIIGRVSCSQSVNPALRVFFPSLPRGIPAQPVSLLVSQSGCPVDCFIPENKGAVFCARFRPQ